MGAKRLAQEGMDRRGPGQALATAAREEAGRAWVWSAGPARRVCWTGTSPPEPQCSLGTVETGSGSGSLPNRRAHALRDTPAAEGYGIAGPGAHADSGFWDAGGLPARLPPSCVPVLPSLMGSGLPFTQ